MDNFDFDFDNMFSELDNNNKNETVVVEETKSTSVATETISTEQKVADSVEKQMNSFDMAKRLTVAVEKINRIGAELNNEFVEREDVIKLLQLAIISKTNALLLGPPGTAKTKITHDMCSRIVDSNYFEWMMNKTSDPSEILGSFSVKQMENDRFMRVTKGKLPEAHIAFLDEVYKSNAPCLNAILTIMNEHIFYNDGVAVDIPLITLVGASNEPPEDESLAALHDRFIFRINVNYVSDAGNKKRMHNNYINARNNISHNAGGTTITLEEIELLNERSKQIVVSKDIINTFIRLIASLGRNAIHVSDRRQNECFKVMQSSAVLNNRNNVVLDDFIPLTYVLWEQPEHIPVIAEEIAKLVNPYDDKIREIKDNYNQIKKSIEGVSDQTDKMRKCIEAKPALDKLVMKANKLINDAAKNGKDVTEFVKIRDGITNFANSNIQSALGSTLGIDNLNFNGAQTVGDSQRYATTVWPSTSTSNPYTFTTTVTNYSGWAPSITTTSNNTTMTWAP